MVARFTDHITTHFPELLSAKILIAVSGGLDSMTLAHLCHKAGLQTDWAHCNFNLRGDESDGDTAFVQRQAYKLGFTCHVEYFDTYAFAKAYKQSTQMAARTLRYEWFNTLITAGGYDFLLTAHHANDNLETVLINISRGTGIDGLTGIPERNTYIRRPLLPFTRADLEAYAEVQNVAWREDSSNATDNYVRNHLRHHAVPALLQATPTFIDGFATTQEHLKQSRDLLDAYKRELKKALLIPFKSITRSGFKIEISQLKTHKLTDAVLYALLSHFGFTAWDDIYALPDAMSGKQIVSETHTLLKDRDVLLLFEKEKAIDQTIFWDKEMDGISGAFGKLAKSAKTEGDVDGRAMISVDADIIDFPLTVRRWKEGDYFYPFGMKGKKKLSKYLKDEKLSLIAKEQVFVLCAGADIVWVIGMRADDRFKITPKTKNSLKLKHTYDLY